MERNNVPFDGCGCGCEGVVSSDRDSSADAKKSKGGDYKKHALFSRRNFVRRSQRA